MANSFSSAQISRLKRQAKKVARERSLIHAEALDLVAAEQGFANWSLLSKACDLSVACREKIPEATKASALPRYYLHGDQDEQDPSVYYCARCDRFGTPDHFSDTGLHRGQSDEMRYLDSIERWNEASALWRAKWHRPEDAINLLAAKAVSMNAAYQKSRSPFHRWLLTQLDRDDNVAYLAVDVRDDEAFPVTASSLREIRTYLSRYGDHVLEALEQAWGEFSARSRRSVK